MIHTTLNYSDQSNVLQLLTVCRLLLAKQIKNNSETQRLVQNVILKLEKINKVLVKPVMVKHPLWRKLVKPVTVMPATHT